MLNSISSKARRLFHRLFENELIRRVVKNSGYLLIATIFTAAIGMVQSILAARLLGVAAFGVLGVITLFATILNKLVSFRMSELVVKYVGQFTEGGDQPRAAATFKAAALSELGASVLAFTLIWLLAPLGARYFAKDPTTAGWFGLYGLVILANLIAESSKGLLQIFNRFRQFSVVSISSSLVTLSIVIIVYYSHGGFEGILIAYISGKTVEAVGLSMLALREASLHWSNRWWRTPVGLLRPYGRQMIVFAINTNISASLSLITKDSELLWVALLRGPVDAGYYKVAMAMANIVQLPISPLPQATYPELSREVARRNWDNVRYVLRQGSLLAGSYSLVVTIFLILFGRPILGFLYKPAFLPSYPALLILLAGFMVANTFYWNRVALLSIGRADIPTKVNLVLAFAKILGILLLVPSYGYLASAALLAGSYILGVSYSVIRFRYEVTRRERTDEAPAIPGANPDQK